MIQNNIIYSILALLLFLVALKVAHYIIKKEGQKRKVIQKRIFYVTKFTHIFIYLVTIFILAIIWSEELKGVMIFASSVFTVIGVALFAQWSVLSNITSSIIIFFSFPTRVGDKIKILDEENSIEGKILEISLFQIKILDSDKNIVLYPNNLFIQKPIKIKKKV